MVAPSGAVVAREVVVVVTGVEEEAAPEEELFGRVDAVEAPPPAVDPPGLEEAPPVGRVSSVCAEEEADEASDASSPEASGTVLSGAEDSADPEASPEDRGALGTSRPPQPASSTMPPRTRAANRPTARDA